MNAGQSCTLSRLDRSDEDESRYLHPHGYVIVHERRTWSERVGAMRGQAGGVPLTWWTVYPHLAHRASDVPGHYHAHAHRTRGAATCDTLREARAWCDTNPRRGWAEAC